MMWVAARSALILLRSLASALRRWPRIRFVTVRMGGVLAPGLGGRRLPATTRSGLRLSLDPADPMQLRLFLYGSYSERELQVFLPLIRPGDVCLDVGAHIGLFTLEMARRTGPSGRVLAFEPAPDTRVHLGENLRANSMLDVVEVYPVALSDTNGRLPLYEPADLADVGRRSLLSGPVRGSEVEVARFDDLDIRMERLDVVKIDVEGGELAVLIGMTSSLQRFRPRAILLETEEQLMGSEGLRSVEDALTSFGYRPDPRISGSNSLYVIEEPDQSVR